MTTFLTAALILMQSIVLPASRGTLTLQGRVTDQTGGFMAGVVVAVMHEGNKLPRLAVTNEAGRYLLSELRPGKYEIVGDAPDFARNPRIINLTESAAVNLTLRVTELDGIGGGVGANTDNPQPAPDPRAVKARKDAERAAGQLWRFILRVEDLERSGQTNERSYQVIREFYTMGKDAGPALILALQDEDVQVRRNAAVILAHFAAPLGQPQGAIDIREALPTLRERLQDPDAEVRQNAQRAIRSTEGVR